MKVQEARLEDLIKRLEAERGMGRKARLLAGSWPFLRELLPKQRERVALAVGSRWAWRNLESLFGHPDKLSENQLRVQAIFERMSDADVNELSRLSTEIKQGGLGGARSRLLGAVEELLEEKLAAESGTAAQRPAAPAVAPERTEAAAPEQARMMPESSEEEAASEFRARSGGPGEPGEPGQVSEPGGLEARLEEPIEEEIPGVAPAKPEPVDAPATDTGRHELEPGAYGPAVEGVQEEEVLEEELEDEPNDRRRRDAATLSAVESLRVLRRLSSGETASSRAGRAELVGSLGSGWAARRAVSSMILSRSAADLDEALALIRRLPTATHQSWCLGDLLQHWELDDQARARVLAAAPTKAAKRRLARRGAG